MTVNSHSVRIQASRIEIDHSLEIGSEVSLSVVGDVVKREEIDNHDGSVDVVYIVKGFITQ